MPASIGKEDNLPDISETSTKASAFLEAARTWVGQSENPAVSESEHLKRRIGLALYRQSKLEEAAGTQMSIGVYGASQAGKSYFVSALAKGKGQSVSARIGEREVNFLTEINPSGGKESTGLVTRFTRQPSAASKNFPVKISLLCELDLVKIIANSFYEDLELEAERDEQSHVARSQKILNENPVAGASAVTVEGLIDLSVYCDKHFAANSYYSALKQAGYWSRLEQLAPGSDLSSRRKYYSLLWDNAPPYDRLFEHLANQLARFAGASSVMCEPSALFDVNGDEWKRSERSVINVTSMDSLGSAHEKQIKVFVSNAPVFVGIGLLSALASEITINIANEPHEFFENADLLDFPGARSRHPINRKKFEETVGLPIDHFLRGKVAYLFERYCNNFGMSALLLCIGPSNQEVVGLNRLIEDWIIDSVGARPEQREGQPVTLFAVLTKFDSEFVLDAGKAIDESRWSTRIMASLVKPFGGQQSARTDWLDHWDKKSAFKNAFWWRSPSADQPGLIKYGSNRTEVSILEERKENIVEFRHAYMKSELVGRHFRDPEAAWEGALQLNDGGAEYLVRNLALVCRHEMRVRQIYGQFVQNCEPIASQLRNYHVAGNLDEMQAAKKKLAITFIKSAAGMLQRRCAGEFLAALVMDEQSGLAFYEKIHSELKWSTLTPKSAKEQGDLDFEALEMLGLSGSRENSTEPAIKGETLVREFIAQWASSLMDKFKDQYILDRFGIDFSFVETLCAEAVTGFERTGGVTLIARALEHQHESSWKSATILTTLVNDFLIYVTLNGELARDVIRADGVTVKIFAGKAGGADKASRLLLSDRTKAYSRQFLADWAMGFYDMINQNAFIDLQNEQMIKENRHLSSILTDFSRMQEI